MFIFSFLLRFPSLDRLENHFVSFFFMLYLHVQILSAPRRVVEA